MKLDFFSQQPQLFRCGLYREENMVNKISLLRAILNGKQLVVKAIETEGTVQ
jgi:hypothetical protein